MYKRNQTKIYGNASIKWYFRSVKRIGAYLLILALFSADNVLKEFLKTPLLVDHFIVHQQKDPAIGWIRFMSMHYFGHDLKDNDWKQDMKLPFKKISSGPHHALFQPPLAAAAQTCRENYLPAQETFYAEQFFSTLSCSRIDRPPQVKMA